MPAPFAPPMPRINTDAVCGTHAWLQWVQRVRRRTPLTSAEARTVAFMDIGTNSIRLLLVRLHPNHSYTILTELRQSVRLGEGEFTSKHLQPAAMERTVLVAKEFAELARANGAEESV